MMKNRILTCLVAALGLASAAPAAPIPVDGAETAGIRRPLLPPTPLASFDGMGLDRRELVEPASSVPDSATNETLNLVTDGIGLINFALGEALALGSQRRSSPEVFVPEPVTTLLLLLGFLGLFFGRSAFQSAYRTLLAARAE